MPRACYSFGVSAIQVKNVPELLHRRLRERAQNEGRSLSEYILEILERDLATPSTREWLSRLKEDPAVDIEPGEIARLIQEGRAERDEQILSAIATRH
jgi:plasmid stability protein